jgi:hypothetical protein
MLASFSVNCAGRHRWKDTHELLVIKRTRRKGPNQLWSCRRFSKWTKKSNESSII